MEPSLCAGGCGFYGSAATNNLCSKCYKNYLKESNNESLKVEVAKSSTSVLEDFTHDIGAPLDAVATKVKDKKERCKECNKKVGLTGFKCRCGDVFCGKHRYPEEHACNVDYKKIGRQHLIRQNPLIISDKLENKI